MFTEIEAASPGAAAILGVNAVGQESGNAAMVAGRTRPWLQDVTGQDVWSLWDVAFRDVVVLDGSNRVYAIYNVTANDLAVPANYDALRALILAAAAVPP